MDPIYNYSLCAALPLMLFFGFYFLFARTPEKAIFDNFSALPTHNGSGNAVARGQLFGAFLYESPFQ